MCEYIHIQREDLIWAIWSLKASAAARISGLPAREAGKRVPEELLKTHREALVFGHGQGISHVVGSVEDPFKLVGCVEAPFNKGARGEKGPCKGWNKLNF